jgi:hypothetical protein
MEKVDRKSLAHSYSRHVTFADSSSSSLPARPSLLRIGMEDIVHMAPYADLSLPPGSGFCIDTVSGPHYLVHFFLTQVVESVLSIPLLIVYSLSHMSDRRPSAATEYSP